MRRIFFLVMMLIVVYPLVAKADDWKTISRNTQIGNTLIIENPNK